MVGMANQQANYNRVDRSTRMPAATDTAVYVGIWGQEHVRDAEVAAVLMLWATTAIVYFAPTMIDGITNPWISRTWSMIIYPGRSQLV